MNIKRAFLAAVAVLMVPGFALAQSTHTFQVVLDPATATADVSLSCNSGIPLAQSGSYPVTFSVIEVQPATTCSIVVTGNTPDGYEIFEYWADVADPNDPTDPGKDADACIFGATMDTTQAHTCFIAMVPSPAEFSVLVGWDIDGDADDGVGDSAAVTLECADSMTTMTETWPAGPTAPMPVSMTVNNPPATCSATISNVGSAVEVGGTCEGADFTVDIGDGTVSCTFELTAFYEGIPTLSQYGMAIMALLMLAVGFVGFRRFV